MSREILFRGKHIHVLPQNEHLDGTWVYGYLCDKNYISTACEDEYGGKFVSEVLVDPETVCQFTGVYDNTQWEELSEHEQNDFLSGWNFEKDRRNTKEDWNGRKIFENDIIEVKNAKYHFRSQIEWDSSCGGFMFQDSKDGSMVGLDALLSGGIYNDFKLIGSIFDNHELIGEQK